jgi:hypothetical protein
MRTNVLKTMILVSSVCLGTVAAEPPTGSQLDLEPLFQTLVAADGPSYFVIRSNLVAHDEDAVRFLERKRASDDLRERIFAAAALSWIREGPTNYERSDLLAVLLGEALRGRGSHLDSILELSFGVRTWKGPIQPKDALHQDAAVPFLLEAALKGPTPVTGNPRVTKMAQSYSVYAQCMATALVGGYHGADVLPALRELLHSPNPSIRACAVTGLRRTKTLEGTELIGGALTDPDPAVRFSCRVALYDLTDRDFQEDQAKWLNWWKENKDHWPFNDRVPGNSWAPPLPPLPAGTPQK